MRKSMVTTRTQKRYNARHQNDCGPFPHWEYDRMICRTCGAETTPEAIFCQKCGERLAEQIEAEGGSDQTTEQTPEPGETPSSSRDELMSKMTPTSDAGDDTEEELWSGGYSPKAMIGRAVLAGVGSVAALICGFWFIGASFTGWLILLAVILLVWIALGILLAYRRMSVHYRLTNQRFVHESGILRRVTDRIEVIDMDDITFEQGLIERMVGVGTIKITSSDRTHPVIVLSGIDNVREVSLRIDNARRKERVRRGVHIESI